MRSAPGPTLEGRGRGRGGGARAGNGRGFPARRGRDGPLKPYWSLVFKFITDVIGDIPPSNHTTAIIFNMWTRDKLGTDSASAFIRHAFGCFYDAFSQIDLTNRPFIHTLVFHETLLS